MPVCIHVSQDEAAAAVQVLHAAVPEEHLGYLLNACLVGLARTGSGSDLECLGVGIVRAVDMPAGMLYVLTPLDPDTLDQVTTLQVRSPHSGFIESIYLAIHIMHLCDKTADCSSDCLSSCLRK